MVDPGFLELVRFGVLPAGDATIRNSIKVVDAKLSYRTAHGRYWHRASFDGYGEQNNGGPWLLGTKEDSFVTHGRGWPLLSGERGEYDLAAHHRTAAADQLRTMAQSANSGGMLPEQVWDHHAPAGRRGFTPGHADVLGHAVGLDPRPVHPARPRPRGGSRSPSSRSRSRDATADLPDSRGSCVSHDRHWVHRRANIRPVAVGVASAPARREGVRWPNGGSFA